MTTLPSRAAPETFFEWYDRAGRPTLRFAGVFMIGAIGLAFAVAFWRSALLGVPMPDMTGGLMPLMVVLAPNIVDLITRHLEVMRGGGRSHSPLAPPAPDGGLVNNNALQGA